MARFRSSETVPPVGFWHTGTVYNTRGLLAGSISSGNQPGESDDRTHRCMPSCSSGFQLASTCSIPSTVRPSPSIGSGTGLIPLGQAVLQSGKVSVS